jgi:hypothetical protein
MIAVMDSLSLLQQFSAVGVTIVFAVLAAAMLRIGIAMMLLASLVTVVVGDLPVAVFGATNVYIADAVFGILAVALLVRLLRKTTWSLTQLIWIAFGACIIFSWVRGIQLFGLNVATNGFREFFYFWTGTAYVASFRLSFNFMPVFYRYWTAVSLVLCVIVISRFFFPIYAVDQVLAVEADNGFDHLFGGEADWLSLRMLTVSPTFMLAQTALLGMILVLRGGKRGIYFWLLPIWLGMVVLMQHRTVWITFAATVLLILPTLRLRGSNLLIAAGGVAIACLGALVAVGMSDIKSTMIGQSLTGAVNEVAEYHSSTFYFRVLLWENYFDEFAAGSLVEHLFGKPFGTVVFSWIAAGTGVVFTDAFPHNFYIYCVFYAGILGVALLVLIYALLIPQLWRLKMVGRDFISGRDWSIMLIAQLIYSVTYGLHYEQGIILGIAISLAARYRRTSAATRPARQSFGTGARQPVPSILQRRRPAAAPDVA